MTAGEFDAVLPLIHKDYDRFTILEKSLKRYVNDLGTLYIVTSDKDSQKLQSLIDYPKFQIINEMSLIPEFSAAADRQGGLFDRE